MNQTKEALQNEIKQLQQQIEELKAFAQEQEERLRAFASAIPDVAIIFDKEGRYIDFIASDEDLLVPGTEQMMGKIVFNVLPPDKAELIFNTIQRTLESGKPQMVEYTLNVGAGIKWFEGRVAPIENIPRLAGTVVWIALDITDRKKIEETLRASEQRYQTLTSTSPVGIFRTDLEGNCTYVNKRWEDITGYTFEEAKGPGWLNAIHPEDRSRATEEWRRAVEKNLLYKIEVRYQQPDGTTIWGLSQATPERNENREVIGYIGTVTNITERKRAEAEREHLQQALIEAQQAAIKELSTPIIPIMERIIILPLIGSIDTQRARDITRSLLAGISQHRAKVVIIDITGVPVIDSGIATYLDKAIQAARLKGAQTIITGVSDSVAETIVDLGIDWSNLQTLSDLQTGLTVAMQKVEEGRS